MVTKKSITGKVGEDLGSKYIAGRGFRVLKRNYREKFDEIDIIAIAKNQTLVFFEVKTLLKDSKNDDGFLPEDNFTQEKSRKIKRACASFAGKHPELIKENKGWRIDLLAIIIDKFSNHFEINHYENVV